MKRVLLMILFVGLMADGMFGWGLGIAPGLSLKNALLYVLVLLLGMEVAISGRLPSIILPRIQVFFVLLIFVAGLSWTANSLVGQYTDYSAWKGFISLKGSLLDHYLFFLVFLGGVQSERDVLWLQKWLLLLIGAGSIVTVMDAYNFPDLYLMQTRADGRVTGPIGEPNQFGLFVAMFLPILVAQSWIERGLIRWILAISAAASFWVLLITGSRGAFGALLAGLLISVFMLRHYLDSYNVKRIIAGGTITVLAIALLVGKQYGGLIVERFVDGTVGANPYELTSGRNWIWAKAIGIMLTEPLSFLTGYGWYTFRTVVEYAAHNVYLERFFELGVLGLVFAVGLMVAVLFYAYFAISLVNVNSSLHTMTIGFFCGFAILTIGILTVDLAEPWYFIWSYAGLAMRGVLILQGATPTGHSLREPLTDIGEKATIVEPVDPTLPS